MHPVLRHVSHVPCHRQAAVAGIVDKGGVAVYAPLDVLDDDQPGAPDHAVNVRSMTRTAAFVKATFGRLDVLVNNAGVGARHPGWW